MMIKLGLTPNQRLALAEVMDGRDYDEGTILHAAGIQCWDGAREMVRAIREDRKVSIKVAGMLADEAAEYADIRGCRTLREANKRIIEAIGAAFGIQPPAKPAPKPRAKRLAPVMEPTKPKASGPFKLRPPEGVNPWCGPTAIGALMGVTTDMVAEKAKLIRGRKVIKGMYMDEAIGAIRLLGGYCTSFGSPILPRKERPTLKQWHAHYVSRLMFAPRILVETTRHWVAVHGDDVLCSLQKGRAAHHIACAAAGRMKVVRAWIIEDTQPKHLLDTGGFRL